MRKLNKPSILIAAVLTAKLLTSCGGVPEEAGAESGAKIANAFAVSDVLEICDNLFKVYRDDITKMHPNNKII